MSEFFQACTQSPVNLALSILLVLILGYWLVVIVGAVGIDSLDFLELSLDADGAADGMPVGAGVGSSMLRFFHVGSVPVLVLGSILVLVLWIVGVLAYPWFGHWSWVLQLLLLIPAVVVAAVVTKLLTWPLKHLFDRLEAQAEAEQHVDLIGRRCLVVSLTVDHRHGQVEIATDGAPLRLHARLQDPQAVLHKGQEAVLVAEGDRPGLYIVRGF